MKTHKWIGDQLVITITDAPAAGEYRPDNPFETGGLLTLGVAKVEGKDRMIRTKISDFPGLAEEIYALRCKMQAAFDAQPQRCDRCGDMTPANQTTWNWGKINGMRCKTPYCPGCAKLLRIFAGGIGVSGEPMESRIDDRTPSHKQDF